MNVKLKCPLCGSHRIQTFGGENGDPFNRTSERTVCLDCGMTLNAENFFKLQERHGHTYETGNRFKN